MLIDSQVHTWSHLLENHRPSPNRDPATIRDGGDPYTNEDLLRDMDTEGVDRALLYPPGWSAGGLQEALQAAKDARGRFGVVASIEPYEGPENHEHPWEIKPGTLAVGRGQVRQLLSFENLVGVRARLGRRGQTLPAMDDPEHWCWAELEESGIRVMAAQTGDLDGLYTTVQRHSQLRFAIDGLGISPDLTGADAVEAIRKIIRFADCGNVAIKACHLPRLSKEPFPFRDLHEIVVDVVRAFGRQRVFWGSNVSITTGPYSEGLHMLDEISQLSADDVIWMTGRGLSDWLGR